MFRKPTDPSPIIFLGQQRSGTTVLQKVFESTAKIRNFDEVFHTGESSLNRESNYFNFKKKHPPNYLVPLEKDVREHFRSYLNYLAKISERPYYLMDIKYNSWFNLVPAWQNLLAQPFQLSLCKELNIPIIHIIRINVILQALSMEYARASNKWHFQEGEEHRAVQLRVDPIKLLYEVRLSNQNTAFFRRVLQGYSEYAEIEYERAFVNSTPNIDYLRTQLRGLRIPTEFRPYAPMRKTPAHIPDLVVNPQEVLDVFASTEFAGEANSIFYR